MAKEKLEAEGKFKSEEPAAKKKRPGSVEPLDRSLSATPLPELPEDLKQKQVGLHHTTRKQGVLKMGSTYFWKFVSKKIPLQCKW